MLINFRRGGVLILSACSKEEEHKHNYVEVKYSIENGKAYTQSFCECGEADAKKELDATTYVIATPSTAQAVLDSDINNKTVFFDNGTYSNLVVRPTVATAKAYEDLGGWQDRFANVRATEETPLKDLDASTSYHYIRTLTNVKFVGLENAKFAGSFEFVSKIETRGNTNDGTDIIKNIPYTDGICAINKIEGNGIEFNGLNFISNNENAGRINFDYNYTHGNVALIKNVVVKNCKFTNNIEAHNDKIAVRFYFDAENFTFENNSVTGYKKGVDVYYTKNIYVKNNTIENTAHNAIGMYYKNSGEVVIENNTIKNTSNRSIKIYDGDNLNITLKDNKIKNGHDENDEIMQFANLTNSTLTMSNNVHNDSKLVEFSNKNITELYPEGTTSYSIVKA